MQFTDFKFLFAFLPLALLAYYLVDNKVKPYVLLAANLIFYALCQIDFFVTLCILTVLNKELVAVMERSNDKRARQFLLFTGICLNVGVLAFCKYRENALLPLGLSFYVFKAVNVLADCYKGKIDAGQSETVVNYLLFFGQIQSGPISRFAVETAPEPNVGGYRLKQFAGGIERFAVGFSKKILLANVLVKITDEVFSCEAPSLPFAWLGAVCFSLQLYYDFSGYSDMAVGVSGMFGVPCDENFDYPYTSVSIAQFWRKWHITLGQWFRDYVYIPLGGSRVKVWRAIFNLGVVWILTGIWHGSTSGFLVWGLFYFGLIVIEKYVIHPERFKHRCSRIMYRIYSLIMVNFLWVVFYFGHVTAALRFIKRMLVPSDYDISQERAQFLLNDYKVFITAAVLFAMPVVPAVMKFCQKRKGLEIASNIVYGTAIAILFVMSLAMLAGGESNPFLYVGF